MNRQEIYIKALRLFEKTMIAYKNWAKGCPLASEQTRYEEGKARFPKMYAWLKENNLDKDFLYWWGNVQYRYFMGLEDAKILKSFEIEVNLDELRRK